MSKVQNTASQPKPAADKSAKKSPLRFLLPLLLTVFLLIFSFSAYKLYSMYRGYKSAEKQYNDLSGQFLSTPAPTRPPSHSDEPQPEETEPPKELSPITVDFAELLRQSKDIVGWIYSPDTPINYPVVQAADNDFYLYNFIDGTYNGNGSIFMDCMCQKDMSSRNTIIYGHNMHDGSMFASLHMYRQEGYYKDHPVMYFNTPNGNYKLLVFSGYVSDPEGSAYWYDISDNDDYQRYLNESVSLSDFRADVVPTVEDKILTLSTCTYEYFDARYVIQAIVVPLDE